MSKWHDRVSVCVAWSAWFQDVVSLWNWAGSWVWVKQNTLYKRIPPTTWGRRPWLEWKHSSWKFYRWRSALSDCCCCWTLYILIYIYILLLYRLSVPLSISPGKPYITSKVSINALKSRYPPERALLSQLRLVVHQTLRFPMPQRRHVTNPHNNPMFLVHSFFYFSKYHWRPHFSYGFDMTSTCFKSCDPTNLTKITWIPFSFIFLLVFQWFHVSTNRFRFGDVIKN